MSKQMSITIPDEIYERLRVSSEESMRPIATEAVYRIKVGLGGVFNQEGPKLDTEDKYEIKERVVVKPRKELPKEVPKEVRELERKGLIKKGIDEAGKKGLPMQDVEGHKAFFKR